MTIKKVKILIPAISIILIIFTHTMSLAWDDVYTDRPAPQLRIVGEGDYQDIVIDDGSSDPDMFLRKRSIENKKMGSGIVVSSENPPFTEE